MKNLKEVLREKERMLLDLRRDIEILRAAGQILGDRVGTRTSDVGPTKLSQPQMIRTVLLAHARPLHVDEIQRKVNGKFGVSMKKNEITSVIYRAIRSGTFFRKLGINTFGLIEWKGRQNLRGKTRNVRRAVVR